MTGSVTFSWSKGPPGTRRTRKNEPLATSSRMAAVQPSRASTRRITAQRSRRAGHGQVAQRVHVEQVVREALHARRDQVQVDALVHGRDGEGREQALLGA